MFKKVLLSTFCVNKLAIKISRVSTAYERRREMEGSDGGRNRLLELEGSLGMGKTVFRIPCCNHFRPFFTQHPYI